MSTFTRLEIWTDVACASGVRVAVLDPPMLASAVLKTSLTGVESLSFVTARGFAQAAELIHGRVVRVCWSDTTLDTEWRINEMVDQSGSGDAGQLAVGCQSIILDLARAPYVDWDSAGHATFAFSGVQLTPDEWIDLLVLPACVEAGLTWIARGTVDFTTEFDLNGEFVTALEIIRSIVAPGRAPGEFALRRNGNTDYKIDILVARGLTATTVNVQTSKNLLAHQRTRRFQDLGTKIIARASDDAAVMDMSQAYWRVKTVVSGTVAELEDPNGGDGPIGFDDQLNGLYVAPIASTLSSQAVSDSVASTQRITVTSTAGWTGGTTLLRFFRTSGASPERVISLSHPTRALAPSAGGYGQVTRYVDVPGVAGDANLVANPWLSTWTTSGNPPDGYTKTTAAEGGTFTTSRESTVVRLGTYSWKAVVVTAGANNIPITPVAGTSVVTTTYGHHRLKSGTCTPYTTSGLRHAAHAWVYLASSGYGSGGLRLVVVSVSDDKVVAFSPVVKGPFDQWIKIGIGSINCAAATGGVRLELWTEPDYYGTQDYWAIQWQASFTCYLDSFGFGEADEAISDVVYSGGNVLWQRANDVLASASDVITGYTVRLADLARIDDTAWSDEPLTLGGTVTVMDADLAVTTSQRVVEMEQDLLNPLVANIQLATPETLLTKMIAGGGPATSTAVSGSTGAVTMAPHTAAGLGIENVYTKDEVDAILKSYALLDGTRTFTGSLNVSSGGVGYTVGQTSYDSFGQDAVAITVGASPSAATLIRTLAGIGNLEVIHVTGYDATNGMFVDLVVVESFTGAVGVIWQANVTGSPPTRTYSTTTNTLLKLTLGVGTASTCYIRGAVLNMHP